MKRITKVIIEVLFKSGVLLKITYRDIHGYITEIPYCMII